jgi:diguanylate cyclase (GGDEF)-like protein
MAFMLRDESPYGYQVSGSRGADGEKRQSFTDGASSDVRVNGMVTLLQRFGSTPKQLPDRVFVELVDILFTAMLPTIIIGIAVALIGALIAETQHDSLLWVLTGLSVVLSVLRILMIQAYHRRKAGSTLTTAEARLWERRYATGSLTFALLIGIMNALELSTGFTLAPMLITGLTFGYAAGLVTRVSVRPVICFGGLMLAAVPTVVSFGFHISGAGDFNSVAGFAVQTLILGGFVAASLESVSHLYQTTVRQLVTKRDLAALAGTDALTGLPNRILLRARFDEGVVRTERSGGQLMAIHCLDLDRFKFVNDTHGHPTGDALLQAVSQRMMRALQAGDTVARRGGDEFIIVQPCIRNADEARLLGHRIVKVVSEPYSLNGHDVRIGASLGIAFAPRDGTDLEHLTACADAALYRAKRGGRGTVIVAGDPPPPSPSAAIAC